MSSWAAIYERPGGSHWTKFFKDAARGEGKSRDEAEHWIRTFAPPEADAGGRRFLVRLSEVTEVTP